MFLALSKIWYKHAEPVTLVPSALYNTFTPSSLFGKLAKANWQ
jgi:hypothetical protein